jgi:hypothetical protein
VRRGEAARELARLTEVLVDAVEVGDMDAAGRVLSARADVVAAAQDAPPPDVADLQAIGAAAVTLRAAEARVLDVLRRGIAATEAAIGDIGRAATAVSAYEGPTGLTAGYVDRRD